MTKLTEQEIASIKETLLLNNMRFEDFIPEMTDHIATEIEHLMFTENVAFDAAVLIVFEKWKSELAPREGLFWVSSNVMEAEIVMKHFEKCSKKEFLNVMMVGFIATSIIFLLKFIGLNNVNVSQLNNLKDFLGILILAVSFIVFYRIKKSEKETTSGFIFKRKFVMICCLLGSWFTSDLARIFDYNSSISQVMLCFFRMSFLSFSIFALMAARNHFRFLQKFKIASS